MEDGEAGRFAGPVHETIALDPVGAGVAGVVEFDDQERTRGRGIAEQEVRYGADAARRAAARFGVKLGGGR